MQDYNFLKNISIFTYIIVILGAINFGLIGILKFDLIAFLFGDMSKITRSLYLLTGLSGLISLIMLSYNTIENKCD